MRQTMQPVQKKTSLIRYAKGQRWISTSEPELGLGTIVAVENRRIEISFATHSTTRTYAFDSAPLQRIAFTPGNTVEDIPGRRHTVSEVSEDPLTGLITYRCEKIALREDELADTLAFSTPRERLSAGIADDLQAFEFRLEMLREQAKIAASPIRGFAGGRIDLIPHQLSIAHSAASRSTVRVLLADETGLGKTIEACLILHRLLLAGQAGRAVVLVPDALVHQWFVELLRRFNLSFRVCTEESVEGEGPPFSFEEDPLWICSRRVLRKHPAAAQNLLRSSWDMVIVDEAHHIAPSDALFGLLEKLAERVRSIILLSATPEQFGRKSHFERLRLLDPHRYRSMDSYERESHRLRTVSRFIERVLGSGKAIDRDTPVTLPEECLSLFLTDGQIPATLPGTLTIAELIDLLGVGRAYFRNTRHAISGFPERVAHIEPLEPDSSGGDPYVRWLADFLKRHPKRKVLVITSSVASATEIKESLQRIVAMDIALFHEEMSLLQRDRQAAWFAEEHGPRALVCSESGSEGRNFQFCSDLVLFDLPWNPELLEQRIGRLDRIGQKHTVSIHIPVVRGTPGEKLCRWYHEGVGAFEKNVPAAAMVFEEIRERLEESVHADDHAGGKAFERLLSDTRKRTKQLSGELFRYRDFLLEYASNDPVEAASIIEAILAEARSGDSERVMGKLFDHYGIKLEEAGSGRYALITEYCTDHAFPLPRAERPVITYNRATACSHDTVEFLTIDHPMVNGALDLFLSSPHGTTAFALWNDEKVHELLLETVYLVECIAPSRLRLHRFLAPYPLRIVVDHELRLVTDEYPEALLTTHLRNGPMAKLVAQKQLIGTTFPRLLAATERFADELVAPRIREVTAAIHQTYASERSRLSTLKSQGASVSDGEIEELSAEEAELVNRLGSTRVRCGALKLIWRGAVKGEQAEG